jgi:hypothetical protein
MLQTKNECFPHKQRNTIGVIHDDGHIEPDGDPSLKRSIEVETRMPVGDPAVWGPKVTPASVIDKAPAGMDALAVNISDISVRGDASSSRTDGSMTRAVPPAKKMIWVDQCDFIFEESAV